MSLDKRIIVLRGDKDAEWKFTGDQLPKFTTRIPDVAYQRSWPFDPFPAYTHDLDVLRATAEKVEELFPVDYPPQYYVCDRELIERTNGWTTFESVYNSKTKDYDGEFRPYIFFSGKRVPIHPAVTRYLLPHEYGHLVEWTLEQRLGFAHGELIKDYAKKRKLSRQLNIHYGAGNHHKHPTEVFANDFRILVCEMETEFWPHPYPRPEEVPAIVDFWNEVKG